MLARLYIGVWTSGEECDKAMILVQDQQYVGENEYPGQHAGNLRTPHGGANSGPHHDQDHDRKRIDDAELQNQRIVAFKEKGIHPAQIAI